MDKFNRMINQHAYLNAAWEIKLGITTSNSGSANKQFQRGLLTPTAWVNLFYVFFIPEHDDVPSKSMNNSLPNTGSIAYIYYNS